MNIHPDLFDKVKCPHCEYEKANLLQVIEKLDKAEIDCRECNHRSLIKIDKIVKYPD